MGLLQYLKKILGDEEGQKAYDKIAADKENVLLVDNKKESKYVEKKDLDAANESIKQYKKDIKKRDTDLEDLQDKVKDNKELNLEIENLKKANKKASENYEAELTKLKFDTALEKVLNIANVHNPKTVKALLNLDNVKLDGEDFIGLNEQLEALKESDSYLFKKENNEGDDDFAGGTGNIGGKTDTGTGNKSFGEILGEKRAKEMSSTKDIEDKFFN